jgi:hypothetical protein
VAEEEFDEDPEPESTPPVALEPVAVSVAVAAAVAGMELSVPLETSLPGVEDVVTPAASFTKASRERDAFLAVLKCWLACCI